MRSEVLAAAWRAFPFFLLISAQIKGFGLRRREPRSQILSVLVRKVNTAPAKIARRALRTHPVALALELWRWVSGLPWGKRLCGWERRAGGEL